MKSLPGESSFKRDCSELLLATGDKSILILHRFKSKLCMQGEDPKDKVGQEGGSCSNKTCSEEQKATGQFSYIVYMHALCICMSMLARFKKL